MEIEIQRFFVPSIYRGDLFLHRELMKNEFQEQNFQRELLREKNRRQLF